jgi:hypothetical protein
MAMSFPVWLPRMKTVRSAVVLLLVGAVITLIYVRFVYREVKY